MQAFADDIPTLGTVKVVGTTIEGVELTCASPGCFDAAQEESARAYLQWMLEYNEMPQGDVGLDQDKFCQSLAGRQPTGCSLTNPPSSPGIEVPGRAPWQPNGCGTEWGSWFQDAVLEVLSSESYSGDLDAPYPGVSFLAACNEHDRCWASGSARDLCDRAFESASSGACDAVVNSAGRSTCRGFASLYHGALTTTDGSNSAYSSSYEERISALWARDMRENDCEN